MANPALGNEAIRSFSNEIATHLSGARKDGLGRWLYSLNWDLCEVFVILYRRFFSLLALLSSICLLNKLLDGVEIILEAYDHDVVVGCRRDDEKFLFSCSEVLVDRLCIFERDKAILVAMDNQGREKYFFNPLQTFLIDLFQTHNLWRYSKMKHDSHHAGKTTLDDEPLHLFLMLRGQFQGCHASQRPSHHPQVFSYISSEEFLSDLFKDDMGILNEIGECRGSGTGSITSIVGHDQVYFPLMVKRRNLVIIAYDLAIPVEIQNPRPFAMACVKSAGDGDIIPDRNREVEGIFRAGGKILSGIKDEL